MTSIAFVNYSFACKPLVTVQTFRPSNTARRLWSCLKCNKGRVD